MSEKDKIGILKEKEFLKSKLTKEISSNFSISEKLAKKFIYKTHLSLEEFKNEIKKQKEEIKSKEELSKEKIEKLYLAVLEAKRIIEVFSHKDLENLKNTIEFTKIDIEGHSKFLEKFLDKELINKAKKPKNISEHILGGSLGIVNSVVIISELIYSLGIGILKTPKDLIAISRKEATLESFKRL